MKRLSTVTSLIGAFAASAAFATDIAPLRLKEGHRGQVSDAFIAPTGRYQLGLNSDYAGSLYADPDGNRDIVVKEAVLSNLSLTHGLTPNLELGLALSMSDEIAAPKTYSYVHRDEPGYRAATIKRSRFSGISLSGKYRAYSSGMLSVAAAAAIDSGVLGDNDAYGLTTSDAPTGSWMLITTLGAPRSHQLSLNTGYRYRFSENVGPYVVRNEWFYRGVASTQVHTNIALFGSGEGRRIMKALPNGPFQKGSRRYRPEFSVGLHAGAAFTFDDSEIALYAGRASESSHFGHGMRTYGMSLTMTLGGGEDTAPRLDRDAKPTEFDDMADFKKKRAKAKGPLGEDRDVDFIRDMEDASERRIDADKNPTDLDDFELVERKEKEDLKRPPSSSEMAEEEIERIRAAKKLREEREMKRMEADERSNAKRDYEELKKREKDMKGVEKDVKDQVNKYDTVTDEELNWKGLE